MKTGNHFGKDIQGLVMLLAISLIATPLKAATRYVSAISATPVSPYNSWATAARTIQHAVDAPGTGDQLVATDNIHATGDSDRDGLKE